MAVDRDKFSNKVTDAINNNNLIEIINDEVVSKYDTNIDKSAKNIFLEDLIENSITIIATGPLTSDSLSIGIKNLTGENELAFYDAAAPIVQKDSIDFSIAFYGDRYDEEKRKEETIDEWLKRVNNNKSDYINLPMCKEEYEKFVYELVNAQIAELHNFEKKRYI